MKAIKANQLKKALETVYTVTNPAEVRTKSHGDYLDWYTQISGEFERTRIENPLEVFDTIDPEAIKPLFLEVDGDGVAVYWSNGDFFVLSAVYMWSDFNNQTELVAKLMHFITYDRLKQGANW